MDPWESILPLEDNRSTSLASGDILIGTVSVFAGFVKYLARYNSHPIDVMCCTLLWH